MAIESRPSNRSIPRWMAFILALLLWLVAIPLAHAVLPWAISSLSTRHGWIDGRPGIWNWIGLLPLVASTACLIWIMVVGFAQTPERVELALTPSHLVTHGPYTFTRNPMFVSELGLWLGWSMLYGSIAVLIGFVTLGMTVSFLAVPFEERALGERFGPAYREYTSKTPRWF